jgi:hypothetical protein
VPRWLVADRDGTVAEQAREVRLGCVVQRGSRLDPQLVSQHRPGTAVGG